jgi:hypothetical protein
MRGVISGVFGDANLIFGLSFEKKIIGYYVFVGE